MSQAQFSNLKGKLAMDAAQFASGLQQAQSLLPGLAEYLEGSTVAVAAGAAAVVLAMTAVLQSLMGGTANLGLAS